MKHGSHNPRAGGVEIPSTESRLPTMLKKAYEFSDALTCHAQAVKHLEMMQKEYDHALAEFARTDKVARIARDALYEEMQ